MKYFALSAITGALLTLSCGGGGDPFCGDGTRNSDLGEQCDDGNLDDTDGCRNDCTANLPGNTTISWAFNKDAAPMFPSDSCSDVRAINVEVEVAGPASDTMSAGCSFRQVVFPDLPAGMYTVTVRPLDLDDELLISEPVVEQHMLGPGVSVEIAVPPERWVRDYTGTFFFRTLWGGDDCATAVPPVVQHRFTMTRNGTPLTVTTEDGVPFDGSAPGPCQPFSDEFPQSSLMTPFGLATFTIEGLDSDGEAQFRETFDTFVGAGISNPELHFDVNSLTPDAGVPDAGVPDASI
jgi:cysteine-rich repeat protein